MADLAAAGLLPRLVVDPVLVSSSGHRLMEPEGIVAYLELLLPHAVVATPNLREAAVLGDTTVERLATLDARVDVAQRIRATGSRYVVVKGGHLTESADDVVAGPEGVMVLPGTRVATANDHGTGCSLSAAVAARLALGATVPDAIAEAKAYVAQALAGGTAWHLGSGTGPSTISGGPPRRSLVVRMTLHDADTGTGTGVLHEDEAPAEPLRPPTPGGISMRPAMIVLGLAVLILVVFVSIGVLSSQSPAPVRSGTAASTVAGSPLRAEPATAALAPIVSPGQPPTNIINAVSVPVGAVRVSHQDNAAGSGQYDSQVVLRSGDSQGALLDFYAADMRLQGWQVFDRGPAANDPGAVEILGKLAGSDGYYWEMGATISATTFTRGGPARGQTDFTIRLLQESDDSP